MLATPEVCYDAATVYEPSEDSFLLLDALESDARWLRSRMEGLAVPLVVEVGSGSGVVSAFMVKHGLPVLQSVYLAFDVSLLANRASLATFKRNGFDEMAVDVVRGDLLRAVRRGSVDCVVFNPPYVPAEMVPAAPEGDEDGKWLDLALDGGVDGMEVTWRFLDQLDLALSEVGVAYVVFCARNKPEVVADVLRGRGWRCDEVMNRRAGWEELSIYRIYR